MHYHSSSKYLSETAHPALYFSCEAPTGRGVRSFVSELYPEYDFYNLCYTQGGMWEMFISSQQSHYWIM